MTKEFEWDDKIQLLDLEKINELQNIFRLHDVWSKEEVMKVIRGWFNENTKYVTQKGHDKIKKVIDKMEQQNDSS